MKIPTPCTPEKCEATQICLVCGRRKAPIGRDVAPERAGDLCGDSCDGYRQIPFPGHLWPGECKDMDGVA